MGWVSREWTSNTSTGVSIRHWGIHRSSPASTNWSVTHPGTSRYLVCPITGRWSCIRRDRRRSTKNSVLSTHARSKCRAPESPTTDSFSRLNGVSQ